MAMEKKAKYIIPTADINTFIEGKISDVFGDTVTVTGIIQDADGTYYEVEYTTP